ncbi:hypothetical protein DERF_014669 [Dermatophagoides farinae]|uniref:Uncharacterized protein n=1 Tax=Dermatophagoides farinae TaxID=6954 RepID=A0A922KX88_DERFA|nr:hypothetical protein DERF_014669 [Dermatophagoides farinae]
MGGNREFISANDFRFQTQAYYYGSLESIIAFNSVHVVWSYFASHLPISDNSLHINSIFCPTAASIISLK